MGKDESFWNTVSFKDVSQCNLFGSDANTYVWRRQLDFKNVKGIVKHGG